MPNSVRIRSAYTAQPVERCVQPTPAPRLSSPHTKRAPPCALQVWSLVHSTNMKHVDRGAAVARGKLEEIKVRGCGVFAGLA